MGVLTHLPRRGGTSRDGTPPVRTATQAEMFLVRNRGGQLLLATTSEFEAHSHHRSVGGTGAGACIDRVHVWIPDNLDDGSDLTS